MHERNIGKRHYIRVEHGKSKAEAQKIAGRYRRKGKPARVIPEGGKYSVFISVRKRH